MTRGSIQGKFVSNIRHSMDAVENDRVSQNRSRTVEPGQFRKASLKGKFYRKLHPNETTDNFNIQTQYSPKKGGLFSKQSYVNSNTLQDHSYDANTTTEIETVKKYNPSTPHNEQLHSNENLI